MEIGQRLKTFLESINKNPTQLAKELDIAQTSIKRTLDGATMPSSKILIPLIQKYPSLNLYWLLLGEGDMLRFTSEPKPPEPCEECKEKDLLIASLKGKVEVLKELVSAQQ